MANNEKIYPDGLFLDQKETSFGVIDKASIQVDKFIAFLKKYENDKGYVNLDFLNSQKGGKYAVLNQFVPKGQPAQVEASNADDDDLPF